MQWESIVLIVKAMILNVKMSKIMLMILNVNAQCNDIQSFWLWKQRCWI
jgi:hypothetical protein